MWTSCGGSPSISGQSQVDAAAVVGADEKVNSGSSARGLRRSKEEERRRGKGRKGKGPTALFIS